MQIKPQPRRHYPHAPITEAVIAIGYELPKEVGLEDLVRVHAELKSDYPTRIEHVKVQFQLDPAASQGATQQAEVGGYQLASQDGKRIARLTLGEFAFSQLAPYDRWETLNTEAKRIWTILESIVRPRRINRVAVRFINRIDVPDPENHGVDLDNYFRAAPRIPPELPQALSTYFVRLEIPFDPPHGLLILMLATAASPRPGIVSALLDLDTVMLNVEMDATSAWRTIEQLRDVKNAAFEDSITDAARELLK